MRSLEPITDVSPREIHVPGAHFLRLKFTNITGNFDNGASLAIHDSESRPIWKFGLASLKAGVVLATPLIFTDRIFVSVEGGASGNFRIDLVGTFQPGSTQFLSTVLNSRSYEDFVQVDNSRRRIAAAVAKLIVGDGWVCTGFLVKPSIVVTARHCVEHSYGYALGLSSFSSCSDIELQFDYVVLDDYQKASRTRCLSVIAPDTKLDFSFIEISPDEIKTSGIRRSPLTLQSKVTNKQDVEILQHPLGLPLAYAVGCRVFIDGQSDIVEHDCGTEGGSSGAPLMDTAFSVIGLHFSGAHPENMEPSEVRKREEGGFVFRNKAVIASAILESLAHLSSGISGDTR